MHVTTERNLTVIIKCKADAIVGISALGIATASDDDVDFQKFVSVEYLQFGIRHLDDVYSNPTLQC